MHVMRPMDSMQGFMNSLKQFEKKLDKLQDDLNYHGNTLFELRAAVKGLATSGDIPKDIKPETNTIAVQYEIETKTRRPNAVVSLPSKIKAKSFQGGKAGLKVLKPKQMSSPVMVKHRPRKLEVQRKATSIRPQKTSEKKRSKPRK